MKRILAILMFGTISLMSAQSGAAVTEGDVFARSGFTKGCETGVFSYVVREGHLARMYMNRRQAMNSQFKVSANGNILKIIDRAKMVAVKFKRPDGSEATGYTTFFFGQDPASDPGNRYECD